MTEDIISANKKLNEWCGTEGINYLEGVASLGYLFKYAVPKLQDLGNTIELFSYEHEGFMATVYKSVFTSRGADGDYEPWLEPISQIKDKDPALALRKAIEEVINE